MDAPATRSPVLRAIMLVVAILAIALPAYIATHPPRIPRTPRIVALPKRVVPQAELPPVEPVEFVDLAPDDARAFNAAVPFSTAPNPAARPFRFTGSDDDLARATDCLATAVLYEAGDDTVGEARGGAGGAQPAAASGVSQDGMRGDLRGAGPVDRVPVQLFLRPCADPVDADRGKLAARA